ncbi:MAG TPA: hypothetical protein VGD98_09165 [Ktedonobacteraceae bacterium]
MNSTNWNFPGEDYLPPESVQIAGRTVKAGDQVLLCPGRRGAERRGVLTDALDIMLEGKTARVEKIQQDFENRLYLIVTLNDDPGQVPWDEHVMPGHHFFFFLDEVEPLEVKAQEEV